MKYEHKIPKLSNIKTITIPVDLYHCDIEILMPKEAAKIAIKWNREIDCKAMVDVMLDNNKMILIHMYTYDEATLVHELTHAAQAIMNWIGHDHADKQCDEPFAYLVGHLFGEAQKGIKAYNKRNKKKAQRVKLDKPKKA